jgi:heme exporter protein D
MGFAIDLGPHAAFIVIAYGIATLIVAAMIAWIIVDHRRQLRSLAELEARGVTRRSERTTASSGKVEAGFPSKSATVPPP